MAGDASVRVVFLGSSAGALRAVNQLERGFGSLGRAAGTAAKVLAVGVVGGLAFAVKAAISFDKEMRNVNTIAKLSENQFKSLSKEILGMAKTSGQAPTTLAKGMYQIVSSGFKAQDALKILAVSSKAATAGLTDTETATKAVVSVLNAYHKGAGDAAQVADILFKTVEKGVLSFEELASQIGDVLPVAAQLGVPLEDIGGAMATITLHGVSAAEAATQLKQTLVSILKPSESLGDEIKRMGFETGEMALKTLGLEGFMRKLTTASKGSGAAFAEWFPNVRAMNGALGITGKNIATLHDNIEAMTRAQGASEAAFREQGKSIAVQFQRVKASLTAALIPVGELLFPVLEAAATKVGEFATSIQSHMPQIRAAFQDVSTVIGGVSSALTDVGRSTAGQTAIVGLLSGIATAKGVSGVKGLIQGIGGAMRALGPAGTVAAVGVGILAAAWFAASRQGGTFEDQINSINDALAKRQGAILTHAQATRNLGMARANVETITLQLEGTEKLYARSIDETGRKSLQSRQLLGLIHSTKQQLAQSTADLTTAEQQERQTRAAVGATTKAVAREMGDFSSKAEGLRSKYANLVSEQDRLSASGSRGADSQRKLTLSLLAKGVVDEYAAAVAALARRLGVGGPKAQEYADGVRTLTGQIGRLPTFKEVNIYVKTHHTENISQIVTRSIARSPVRGAIPGAGGRLRPPGRALGGFIPGPVGAPVPILAHAGEVVLNPQQQAALGGPRLLASMFGFTGDEGPGFASGGFVGKKIPPKPSGTHPHKRNYKVKTDLVRAALRGVSAIERREDDATRTFDQTVRGFNLTEESPYTKTQMVPLVYGASPASILQEVPGQIPTAYRGPTSGFETRDPNIKPGDPVLNEFGEPQFTEIQAVDPVLVGRRLREIGTLLGMRNRYLGLLDDEKKALEAALAAIEKAVEALREEIRKEIAAAKAEEAEIQRIKDELAKKRQQLRDERRKTKDKKTGKGGPDKAKVARLTDEIAKLVRADDPHRVKLAAHKKKASDLGGILTDVIGDRESASKNLHTIPGDITDVKLDISELRKERRDVLAVRSEIATTEPIPAAQAAAETGSGDGGVETGGGEDGGGGGDGGGAGSEPTADQTALIAALKAMVAKLRLALGIQEVQLGVLGNFAVGGFVSGARGSPSLNLLHGGEVVLNQQQQGVLGGPERIARIFGFQRFAKGGFVDGPLFSDPGGGGDGPPSPPPSGGPPSGTGGLPPPGFTINPGSIVGGFGGGVPSLRVDSPVMDTSSSRRDDRPIIVQMQRPDPSTVNVNVRAREEALRGFIDVQIDKSIPRINRSLGRMADAQRREGR